MMILESRRLPGLFMIILSPGTGRKILAHGVSHGYGSASGQAPVGATERACSFRPVAVLNTPERTHGKQTMPWRPELHSPFRAQLPKQLRKLFQRQCLSPCPAIDAKCF